MDQNFKKVAAWFMGPKGENGEWFAQLISKSIAGHAAYRGEHYEAADPPYITKEITDSPEYQEEIRRQEALQAELMETLHGCVPFYTPRYQAHMLWDTVMPGMLGYITAMLFNQNNVATEASPATSQMEYEVGQQLCGMLGFTSQSAWGHITADGSIANLESMWAARNIKYFPLALQAAVENELHAAAGVKAALCGGERKEILKCTPWELMNIPEEDALELANDILKAANVDKDQFDAIMKTYQLQNKGLVYYAGKYKDLKQPKIFVPTTNHYSWPKAATVLGLGSDCVEGIPVNENCRMDMDVLNERIADCEKNQIPILMVVGVVGSTEEGAVDAISEIVALRQACGTKGSGKPSIYFHVHCDAAWGGYLKSMLVPPADQNLLLGVREKFVPVLPMSDYAQKQYLAMKDADTITIDPHKAGFIPYPAGSLCYRNGELRTMITFNASYIFSAAGQSMGIYGLEGSKSGAAAAAVWTAHKAIPLNTDGYGRILGECAYSAKKYYCQWLTLANDNDPFEIRMLVKLPKDLVNPVTGKAWKDEADLKKYIRESIVSRTNEEISQDRAAMYVLSELGTDVLINTFAVNYKTDGGWNHDVGRLNTLNNAIFSRFSISDPETARADTVKYILMKTDLDTSTYAEPFKDMESAWGMRMSDSATVSCLVNTIMNPWTTTDGFLEEISAEFKTGIADCVEEMLKQ